MTPVAPAAPVDVTPVAFVDDDPAAAVVPLVPAGAPPAPGPEPVTISLPSEQANAKQKEKREGRSVPRPIEKVRLAAMGESSSVRQPQKNYVANDCKLTLLMAR